MVMMMELLSHLLVFALAAVSTTGLVFVLSWQCLAAVSVMAAAVRAQEGVVEWIAFRGAGQVVGVSVVAFVKNAFPQ